MCDKKYSNVNKSIYSVELNLIHMGSMELVMPWAAVLYAPVSSDSHSLLGKEVTHHLHIMKFFPSQKLSSILGEMSKYGRDEMICFRAIKLHGLPSPNSGEQNDHMIA